MHAGPEPLDAPLPSVRDWLHLRTYSAADWDTDRLRRLKGDQRVSVVLPARNEGATIGDIVSVIRKRLMGPVTALVDEIIVIDSHSDDDTATVAEKAGAIVVHQDQIRSDLPSVRGKGDALWKSLFVASGDILVFLDADVRDFTERYVIGLLGPLLQDARISYVKGFYDRLMGDSREEESGGGRVTELVARPLLSLLRPELSGFVQPLAGEAAGRADVLKRVPFATGYGVEIGMLLDVHELVGLDRLAQVDLGIRRHRHQALADLGVMATQVQAAALRRLTIACSAAPSCQRDDASLVQYGRRDGESSIEPRGRHVRLDERPAYMNIASEPVTCSEDR